MQQQLDRLAAFHVEMKEKLSEKARELSSEIIKEQMPKPRSWRSSSAGILSLQTLCGTFNLYPKVRCGPSSSE